MSDSYQAVYDAVIARLTAELAAITKDRLICVENARREAQLACDLRSSQDDIIERCAKAVDQRWPDAAKSLREHRGSDPDAAVSGEDFGKMRRELAERTEERDGLAAALEKLQSQCPDCGGTRTIAITHNNGDSQWQEPEECERCAWSYNDLDLPPSSPPCGPRRGRRGRQRTSPSFRRTLLTCGRTQGMRLCPISRVSKICS